MTAVMVAKKEFSRRDPPCRLEVGCPGGTGGDIRWSIPGPLKTVGE
jgi:hypothetical protein